MFNGLINKGYRSVCFLFCWHFLLLLWLMFRYCWWSKEEQSTHLAFILLKLKVIVSCRNNGKAAASCSTCDPPRSGTHPPARHPKLPTSSPSNGDLQHHFVQGNSAIFHMCARRFSWFTRMQSYFLYWQGLPINLL